MTDHMPEVRAARAGISQEILYRSRVYPEDIPYLVEGAVRLVLHRFFDTEGAVQENFYMELTPEQYDQLRRGARDEVGNLYWGRDEAAD